MLKTRRLRLREALPDDADFYWRLLNSPGWLRYIGDRKVSTREQARAYIENRVMPSYTEHGFGMYTVLLDEGNLPVGICGLVQRDDLPSPDLGFAMLEEFTRRGLAREAAEAVLAWADVERDFPSLLAITTLENSASQNLLKQLGFQPQGDFLSSQGLRLAKFLRRRR